MEDKSRSGEVLQEVKKQLRLAVPLFTVGLLQYTTQLISVMFVGHLGELALSGASMATSFASVTGFNLLMGMAIGLETLCGQSFGSEQYHMLGIHLQGAMLVLSLMSIFLSIIWGNTRSILIAMHQDPEISKEAGLYAFYMIPGLFAYGLLQCFIKFLQSQNNVLPMILTSGITTLVHVLWCWILVFKSGLGSKGAALSNSISYWINVLLLALYVKFSPSCTSTWTGFSMEALQNVLMFLKIAIPSALMVCLKIWTFEVVVLLSGLLPNPKLETSVLSICINTFVLAWMIPSGLVAAVSTRVSNELGAGRSEAARLAAKVAISMGVAEGILMGILMMLVRNIWGHVYTTQEEVIKCVAAMFPPLALSCSLDAIQGVLSGIASGCGRQRIGACVNLVSFYLVGIPSSIVLAFTLHLKAMGLWLGIIAAFSVQVLLLFIITVRTNWVKQASDAAKRIQDSGGTSSGTVSGVQHEYNTERAVPAHTEANGSLPICWSQMNAQPNESTK